MVGATQRSDRHIVQPLPHFSTSDFSEAKARTEHLLNCTHEMVLPRSGHTFLAELDHTSLAGLGILDTRYRTPVEIFCEPPIPWVTVNFVTRGEGAFEPRGSSPFRVNDEYVGINDYMKPIRMEVEETAIQSIVTLSKTRLEAFLQTLLGRPVTEPLRLAPAMRAQHEGAHLVASVKTIRDVAGRFEYGEMPAALARELEHSLFTALLFNQPNNYTERLTAPSAAGSPQVTDRVVEYIRSSPEVSFTVADLAAFAMVSERALYAAFQRDLDVSPMAYLRSVRMERARADLLSAGAAADSDKTVTDIALRNGFTHVGRFAARYRAVFGELPSTTLRSQAA